MVPQLSVFLQNKAGKIAAITRALHEAGVDIRALSIADTTDFGILRMLVDDISTAKEALTDQHCIIKINDVVIVAVPDVPGALSNVLELMAGAQIDIEYMYSLFNRGREDAYMVFRVSDEARLIALLENNGIRIIDPEEIGLH
ncbi:MAG: amino acid-binding protein [Clostridia bacterium]|nr:amino acid-binding protein [Oscillospiraceae bacterium]MBQ3763249.1 amino acid-binding protein [Clostridia bacterium]